MTGTAHEEVRLTLAGVVARATAANTAARQRGGGSRFQRQRRAAGWRQLAGLAGSGMDLGDTDSKHGLEIEHHAV